MSVLSGDIKHIFFDLDDTLWDLKKNSREGMIKTIQRLQLENSIGKDMEKFIDLYIQCNRLAWEAYYRGELSSQQLRVKRFLWTLELLGISDENLAQQISNTYMEITPHCSHLVDGALSLLQYLKEKNSYRLHILTNGFSDVQPVKLKSGDIHHYFTHVIISDDVGYRKPQKEIFEYARKLVGARQKECLMIGDQYETDILGAKKSGWNGIWLNRFKTTRYTFPYTVDKLQDVRLFL